MDSEAFREAARATIDDIINYTQTLDSRPALSTVSPGYLASLLPATAPSTAEPWPALRADLESKILPGITHWQSPRFMAFFPCANSYPAMLADMWSNALSGAHFNWICSPAVTELEVVVLDWLARAIALPAEFLSTGPTRGGGVIQGSASEVILTVMVAARERYLNERVGAAPEGDDQREKDRWEQERDGVRAKLVVLGSSATHSSTKKAAQILGLRFIAVPVGQESDWALTGEAFADKLRECREELGLEPFFATVTFGTTDTCAVDDLAGIAAANTPPPAAVPTTTTMTTTALPYPPRRQWPLLWLHVDAAYAGAALICPENQTPALTTTLAAYDSFNFNPHKWLLTTFDCSALWVRSRGPLVDALSVQPPYLRNAFSEAGRVTDYRDWQVPLGRRFRSLKLWFVMRAYGLDGLRAHIHKGVGLGEALERKLRSRPDLFEIVTGARFGLVVLRLVGETAEAADERTRRLYEDVNAGGELYLTSTVLGGVFAIRVCTGVAAVEDEHLERAFGVLVAGAEKVLGKN